MRPTLILTLVAAAVPIAGHGQAQVPCQGARRWVAFSAAPEIDADFVTAARAHLAAELAPRGIPVCGPDEAATTRGPPAAHVDLEGRADGPLVVRVSEDATQTTVERSLDLGQMAPAGRGLAFGLAVDELLATRWTAAALAREPVPVAVPKVEVAPAPVTRPPGFLLGLAVSAEGFSPGPWLVGPTLAVGLLRHRWAFGLQGGFRRGTSLASTHGQMVFDDVHAAAGASLGLLPATSRWSLGPTAALEAARVQVTGEANATGVARTDTGIGLLARAGVRTSLRLSRAFGVAMDATAGWVLRPVRGRDDGAHVGGIEGLSLGASLGTWWTF